MPAFAPKACHSLRPSTSTCTSGLAVHLMASSLQQCAGRRPDATHATRLLNTPFCLQYATPCPGRSMSSRITQYPGTDINTASHRVVGHSSPLQLHAFTPHANRTPPCPTSPNTPRSILLLHPTPASLPAAPRCTCSIPPQPPRSAGGPLAPFPRCQYTAASPSPITPSVPVISPLTATPADPVAVTLLPTTKHQRPCSPTSLPPCASPPCDLHHRPAQAAC